MTVNSKPAIVEPGFNEPGWKMVLECGSELKAGCGSKLVIRKESLYTLEIPFETEPGSTPRPPVKRAAYTCPHCNREWIFPRPFEAFTNLPSAHYWKTGRGTP